MWKNSVRLSSKSYLFTGNLEISNFKLIHFSNWTNQDNTSYLVVVFLSLIHNIHIKANFTSMNCLSVKLNYTYLDKHVWVHSVIYTHHTPCLVNHSDHSGKQIVTHIAKNAQMEFYSHQISKQIVTCVAPQTFNMSWHGTHNQEIPPSPAFNIIRLEMIMGNVVNLCYGNKSVS